MVFHGPPFPPGAWALFQPWSPLPKVFAYFACGPSPLVTCKLAPPPPQDLPQLTFNRGPGGGGVWLLTNASGESVSVALPGEILH